MDHTSIVLPNGLSWRADQPNDVRMLWQEIFVSSVYADAAKLLRPGDTVLDVGAHTGLSSLYFASRADDLRIYAVEPAPLTYECLAANLAAHVPKAMALQCAVGQFRHQSEFTYYPNAPSQSGVYASQTDDDRLTVAYLLSLGIGEEDANMLCEGLHVGQVCIVEVTTISDVIADYNLDSIDLLKIDVERAELDVINGIQEQDWPRIRAIIVEVHDVGGRVRDIHERLASRGYRVSLQQEDWLLGTELWTIFGERISPDFEHQATLEAPRM